MIVSKKDYLKFCIIIFHNFIFVFSHSYDSLTSGQSDIKLTRAVSSKGFHRILQYNITLPDFQEGTKLLVIENFPKDIYLDPYQISQIQGPTVFKILRKEPVDTEAPAYQADPFQVFMCSDSQDNVIDLPIHFRYQAPHQCSVLGDNTIITLKSPSLYIIPNHEKKETICGRKSVFLSSQEIPWSKLDTVPIDTHLEIPTGCLEHMPIVTVSAVCTLLVSTYFICHELITLKIDL